MALSVGDQVPEFTVHRAFKEIVSGHDLYAEGAAVVHFYVFDFTGGPEGG